MESPEIGDCMAKKKHQSGGATATVKAPESDHDPLDKIQFFDAKLILKPDFFDSVRGFRLFSELVGEAVAKVRGVKYLPLDLSKLRPRIREVMFLDTADFRDRKS